MDNAFFKGIVFLIVGVILIIYIRTKKEKSVNDLKGYVGGVGSAIFGLYLIFQSFNRSIINFN